MGSLILRQGEFGSGNLTSRRVGPCDRIPSFLMFSDIERIRWK